MQTLFAQGTAGKPLWQAPRQTTQGRSRPALEALDAGRIITCTLDPDKLGKTRARVKALRFWDILLADLGAERTVSLTEPALPAYEDNDWEWIPPYMGR